MQCFAMFYSVLALFIYFDVLIKTSKHSGVIAIFDHEFVRTGKVGKEHSKSLHRMFDARQEFDYRELSKVDKYDAESCVKAAGAFLAEIERMIGTD